MSAGGKAPATTRPSGLISQTESGSGHSVAVAKSPDGGAAGLVGRRIYVWLSRQAGNEKCRNASNENWNEVIAYRPDRLRRYLRRDRWLTFQAPFGG